MKNMKSLSILIVMYVIAGCTVTKQKEYPPVDDSGYTLVEADFKALLFSDKDMVWPEGASIGVYGSEQGYNEPYAIKKAGVGLGQAFFYGPVVKGTIAAYYPYSSSYIGDAVAMPFFIEPEQVHQDDPLETYLKYTPTAFAHMHEGKAEFYYPNGLLRMTVGLPDAVKITGLRIESEKSGLSGQGVVQEDGTVRMTENANNYLVLNCGEGILSRSGDGTLTGFCLVMSPGTYTDLKVSLDIDGFDSPFVCRLPEIVLERIDASDMGVTTLSISPSGGPSGFEQVEVEFDE